MLTQSTTFYRNPYEDVHDSNEQDGRIFFCFWCCERFGEFEPMIVQPYMIMFRKHGIDPVRRADRYHVHCWDEAEKMVPVRLVGGPEDGKE